MLTNENDRPSLKMGFTEINIVFNITKLNNNFFSDEIISPNIIQYVRVHCIQFFFSSTSIDLKKKYTGHKR